MKRKFLSLILIIAVVLPLITNIAYGIPYVKSIDAGFCQIEIHIGNKKIPKHKEPFIYDESIWVPLTDLAKGLNLEYTLDIESRNIRLDSKDRLNTDGSNMKKIESFQLGYEIEAKERIIKDLEGGYNAPQPKDVELRSINIALDEWDIFLDDKKIYIESLSYNNDIYVDILDISPYLYITPSYRGDKGILNIDHNNVLLTDDHYTNIDNLLAFRRGRNYLLNIQLEQLEDMIALKESLGNIPYEKLDSIKDVEKYLNKHFDKIGDLTVDIEADETAGNWIYLSIDFSASQSYRWRRLERKEVEDWIWDMYTAIVKLYDEDSLLHGAIRNPRYSRYSNSAYKNYVTFDTKDKDLYFDFSRSQLQRDNRFNPVYLREVLNKELDRYSSMYFEYSVSKSGSDIELEVYPDSSFPDRWSIYTKMGYLKRLNWEIRRVYPDLTVNGRIVFPKDSVEDIEFLFDNNKIRSYDLLRETEAYLRYTYGSLYSGGYDYDFNFYIYEKDMDNLRLVVEGDFSVNDDKWVNADEGTVERINTRVQNAISTIISLWDMNISTEVMDKSGAVIAELDTYQRNVGMVYANPDEGQVEEGTLVYLYTDTPDADIYYTLDGSTPTRYSQRYTGPIVISRDITINAFGYKEGMGSGPVTSLRYTVVPNDDLSHGLDNLLVEGEELSPSFRRDVLDYEVFVEDDANSITITPYANKGTITIDGDTVQSGEKKTILLSKGNNDITISVEESGKKEKVYTISIYREGPGQMDIDIESLQFSTTIVGIFKGRLSSRYITDFRGYEIRLLSKAGVTYATQDTDSNGSFEITFDNVDVISKIIGYKCEVYDDKGNLVLEMELR